MTADAAVDTAFTEIRVVRAIDGDGVWVLAVGRTIGDNTPTHVTERCADGAAAVVTVADLLGVTEP